MLIENFVALLRAKKVGPNRWRALCPCHDDTRPSLDITPGHTQPIMVICRVCDARAPQVAVALGLRMADLCHDRPGTFTPSRRREERPPFDPVRAAESIAAEAWVLAELAEKFKRGESLTPADHSRLNTIIRRMDTVKDQAGHEPPELARLRGRRAA